MAKSKERTEDLFPQKRIPVIESAILACGKKQAEIDAVMLLLDGDHEKPGLKAELKALEKDLRKAIHVHEGQIDRQQTSDELPVLIYKRGAYEAEVKAHERLSYERVGDVSEGGS